MRRMISAILKGYGSTLTLEHRGDVKKFRGLLQPVRSKGKQYLEHEVAELGQYPMGMYVYIGPPEVPAAEGDQITQGRRRFVLRRVEKFFLADQAVCCWGLCAEEGADPWMESLQV